MSAATVNRLQKFMRTLLISFHKSSYIDYKKGELAIKCVPKSKVFGMVSEGNIELCKTSMMELLSKNILQLKAIYVWQGSKYLSGYREKMSFHGHGV